MMGELTGEQIGHVLRGGLVGRIGCDAEGRTYVVPVTYVYDAGDVYAHSGEGRKTRMMRAHPDVCFEVGAIHDLSHWRSVIGWGRYEELGGPDAFAAMRLLVTRFAPLVTSESAQASHGLDASRRDHPPHAILFRRRLSEKTGRIEKR